MIKKLTLSTLLTLSALLSASVFATPIYGTYVEAEGGFSGNLNSVLGAPDDQFIQIHNNTSITVSFADDQAVLADGTDAVDLIIHTYDLLYSADANIAFSSNGIDYNLINFFSDANPNNVINFDLDQLGIDFITSIRVTDISGEDSGFDLDAIEGVNGGDAFSVPEPPAFLLMLFSLFGLMILQKQRNRNS